MYEKKKGTWFRVKVDLWTEIENIQVKVLKRPLLPHSSSSTSRKHPTNTGEKKTVLYIFHWH